MKKIRQIILLIIAIALPIIAIVTGQNLDLAFFAVISVCALFKRKLVFPIILIFLILSLFQLRLDMYNLLNFLNIIMFMILAYRFWTDMEGKTFNKSYTINVKGIFIVSFVIQISSLLLYFVNYQGGIDIIGNLINWFIIMIFFLGFFLFIVRNINCFKFFLAGGILQLLLLLAKFFFYKVLVFSTSIYLILFIIFMFLIIDAKRDYHR